LLSPSFNTPGGLVHSLPTRDFEIIAPSSFSWDIYRQAQRWILICADIIPNLQRYIYTPDFRLISTTWHPARLPLRSSSKDQLFLVE